MPFLHCEPNEREFRDSLLFRIQEAVDEEERRKAAAAAAAAMDL
jgi:hypothetical protein